MNFTFGIITTEESNQFLEEIIDSITNNNIPEYEIIIVGSAKINETEIIKIIDFDENIKPGWITRKKNIIAQNAKYENIVMLHDYIRLGENWYEGFLKFGDNFEWCVTKITNNAGNRCRDYTLFPAEYLGTSDPGKDIDEYFNRFCLLPYHFVNTLKTNKYLYISGAYYIIKKHIALKHQLDEELLQNQGEDVEYTVRLRNNNIIIKCNIHSDVYFLKQKEQCHWEKLVNDIYLDMYVSYCNNH